MIALSEISQPKRDKHCPVFLLLGMGEEKSIKVKVEHSAGKEKGREGTSNKRGTWSKYFDVYVGKSHHIVSDNECLVATTIIVITIKDSWFQPGGSGTHL